MKAWKILTPLAIVAIGAGAQEATNTNDDFLGPGEVAVVNGERIPESLFRLYAINATQTNPDRLDEEARSQLIEGLIVLRLFADEAEKSGLPRERRIAAELELQRLQLLARYMTERYSEDNPPTETQLRELYEANLERLTGARYKVRHILVGTETAAARIIDDLDDGDDFAELAREFSTDPSAEEGGDLGWVSSTAVPASFAEALAATPTGEFHPDPVETEFGWHVILVEDSEDAAAPPLADIRPDLISAAETQNLSLWAEQLMEAAEIEVTE